MVLVFVPPLWSDSRRYVYAETIQFCVAAFALPALAVIASPWHRLGERGGPGRLWSFLERWGDARARHPSFLRTMPSLAVDVGLLVLWRTPGWMDALARHRWLEGIEVASLAVAGAGVWLEMVPCPPLAPRLPRPWRAVLAALCMWATWIVAYVVGFSRAAWYTAYDHGSTGLSASADQQIATGIIVVVALFAFVPVVFADVIAWLGHEEDPDAELRRLVRHARQYGDPRRSRRSGERRQ